ncbi:ComGF family competence protein [Aquisalibacillus elongatus]|nr:ComGF family competence protein [Aquisalibacillus elongatus]
MDSIQPTEGIQDLEFHQLHFTIDRELIQTDEIAIYSDAIHLYKQDGKHVIYELYGDIIRRRVDYSGNEYILLDVNTFNVNYIQDGIFTITCERSDGTIYEKTYYEDTSKIINITS